MEKLINYDKDELNDCEFTLEKSLLFLKDIIILIEPIDIVLDYEKVLEICDEPSNYKINLY